jgi:hypothetical protein
MSDDDVRSPDWAAQGLLHANRIAGAFMEFCELAALVLGLPSYSAPEVEISAYGDETRTFLRWDGSIRSEAWDDDGP